MPAAEAAAGVDLPSVDPGFRTPMAATLWKRAWTEPGWLFERKLDGVRALLVRDGDRVELWSRTRQRMAAGYPELVEAALAQPVDRFSADGEIVAFDGSRTSFARLQGRMGLRDPRRALATGIAVQLYLFDLLDIGGHDLTGLPLRERKQLLKTQLRFADPVRFTPHRNAPDGDPAGRGLLEQACGTGWEGLIGKRADSRYRHSRSPDWRKLKCQARQELVVGGWTEPTGSRARLGALLLGVHDGTGLRYAGKVGTGFTEQVLRDLRGRLDRLAAPGSPFGDEVPGGRTAHWVRPELVCEVAFSEWTSDGRLRHPSYLGLRTDKDPADVVRERAPGEAT